MTINFDPKYVPTTPPGAFKNLSGDLIRYILSFLKYTSAIPQINRYFRLYHSHVLVLGKSEDLLLEDNKKSNVKKIERSATGQLALLSSDCIYFVKEESVKVRAWEAKFYTDQIRAKFTGEQLLVEFTYWDRTKVDSSQNGPIPDNYKESGFVYSIPNSKGYRAYSAKYSSHVDVYDENLTVIKSIERGFDHNLDHLCINEEGVVFAAYQTGTLVRYGNENVSITIGNTQHLTQMHLHGNLLIVSRSYTVFADAAILIYDSNTLTPLFDKKLGKTDVIHRIESYNDLCYVVFNGGAIRAFKFDVEECKKGNLFATYSFRSNFDDKKKVPPIKDICFYTDPERKSDLIIIASSKIELWSPQGKFLGTIIGPTEPRAVSYDGKEIVASFNDRSVKRFKPVDIDLLKQEQSKVVEIVEITPAPVVKEIAVSPKELEHQIRENVEKQIETPVQEPESQVIAPTVQEPEVSSAPLPEPTLTKNLKPEFKKEVSGKSSVFFLFRPFTWFWSLLKSCFN